MSPHTFEAEGPDACEASSCGGGCSGGTAIPIAALMRKSSEGQKPPTHKQPPIRAPCRLPLLLLPGHAPVLSLLRSLHPCRPCSSATRACSTGLSPTRYPCSFDCTIAERTPTEQLRHGQHLERRSALYLTMASSRCTSAWASARLAACSDAPPPMLRAFTKDRTRLRHTSSVTIG